MRVFGQRREGARPQVGCEHNIGGVSRCAPSLPGWLVSLPPPSPSSDRPYPLRHLPHCISSALFHSSFAAPNLSSGANFSVSTKQLVWQLFRKLNFGKDDKLLEGKKRVQFSRIDSFISEIKFRLLPGDKFQLLAKILFNPQKVCDVIILRESPPIPFKRAVSSFFRALIRNFRPPAPPDRETWSGIVRFPVSSSSLKMLSQPGFLHKADIHVFILAQSPTPGHHTLFQLLLQCPFWACNLRAWVGHICPQRASHGEPSIIHYSETFFN